jgi:hypothetical protein
MVPKKSRETIPLKEVSECDMISFFLVELYLFSLPEKAINLLAYRHNAFFYTNGGAL